MKSKSPSEAASAHREMIILKATQNFLTTNNDREVWPSPLLSLHICHTKLKLETSLKTKLNS